MYDVVGRAVLAWRGGAGRGSVEWRCRADARGVTQEGDCSVGGDAVFIKRENWLSAYLWAGHCRGGAGRGVPPEGVARPRGLGSIQVMSAVLRGGQGRAAVSGTPLRPESVAITGNAVFRIRDGVESDCDCQS